MNRLIVGFEKGVSQLAHSRHWKKKTHVTKFRFVFENGISVDVPAIPHEVEIVVSLASEFALHKILLRMGTVVEEIIPGAKRIEYWDPKGTVVWMTKAYISKFEAGKTYHIIRLHEWLRAHGITYSIERAAA